MPAANADSMRRLTLVALVALATACTACSIIQAHPVPTAQTGTLQGVVTSSGGPVSNATVTVTASDATQHVGVSNADGYYSIASIPAGPATFAVSASGFATSNGNIVINPDPTGARQDVSLNPL